MASLTHRVGELTTRMLVRVFGSANDRILETCRPFLERVNALEPTCRGRTDAELRQTTARLRERHAQGASLDELLPEAFASVREAARRALGMRHYDVQVLGGVALHRGMIAEMVTGEGKTLVATCPAYLNAIPGKGVHVVTVNDYLARRDRDWMAPIYEALGMTVGVIQHDLDNPERQKAYGSDITYGTNNEFGFDYLRDNMKTAVREQVHRGYHYAIVDEVDSILIDEARTPLIIAGPSEEATEKYYQADKAVQRLVRKPEGLPPDAEGDWHFIVKEKEHQCILTEPGLEECERRLGVTDVYTGATVDWPHHLTEALRAHHLYQRDHHYVVKDGEVIIVDEFTGRLMPGRRWSNGLHQAVEAKEGVRIQAENQTLATITLQNYFKLYGKLAGMTGTAKTEEAEFDKIYKLGVATIPTNRPLIRTPFPDVVYMTEREKFAAIVEEIVRLHATGRPLLVGTISIEKSEQLSGLLGKRGVPHQVLNAKHHEREAYIVAKAGQLAAVTIATNMAGRGTDIVLGTFTEAELLAHWRENGLAPKTARADLAPDALEALLVPHWVEHFLVPRIEAKDEAKRAAEEATLRALPLPEARARLAAHWTETRHPILRPCTSVAGLGGLHILGTERHESRRIDNQLRGRAGRQGDPGSSQFFLSLEDKLMRIFAGAWVQAFLRRLGMQEGDDITSPMVSRQIERAQKKVEIHNFEARKNLLEYDEVMNEQRTLIYEMRQDILQRTDQRERVLEMLEHAVREAVQTYVNPDIDASERDPAALAAWLRERTALEVPLGEVQGKRPEVLAEELPKRARASYLAKAERLTAGAKAAVERRVAETLAAVADGAAVFTDPAASPAARDPGGFTAWYRRRTGAPLDPAELTALAADPIRLRETLVERAKAQAGTREREAADGAVSQLETVVLLDVIDAKWKDHLLAMDHLRDSIGLRGYAQVDPKVEYKKEGYQMFREMRDSIRADVVGRLSRVELPEEPVFSRPPPRMMPPMPAAPPVSRDVQAAKREAAAAMSAPPPPPPGAAIPKVGRNDPCPCGSGQKYKKCHGAGAEGGTGVVDGAPTASGAEPPPGTAVPKVGRNQPCPCGSGKKYKQCHGKE